MKRIFSSDRNFKIWTYSVSFRRLLLRSNKGDGGRNGTYASRSEVLFFGVQFMALHPWMNGVVVDECEIGEVPSPVNSLAGTMPYLADGRRWFRISAAGSVGFVAAIDVAFHEDDLEYFDPSSLLTDPDGSPGRV